MLPARQGREDHGLGGGVAEMVDDFSLAAGEAGLGAVEPSAGERLAVRELLRE